MAVTHVGWQTHLSRSGEQNDGTAYAEEYFVVSCSADATSTDVQGVTVGGITAPTFGSLHPSDSSLYCNSTEYTPVQQDTRRYFQCRANYTDDPIINPLTQPHEIEWDFSEDGDIPYFLDATTPTAKKVVNSVGELFQDYLTRSNGTVTATYSNNMTPSAAASMAQTLVAYTNPVPAVNNGTITFDGLSVTTNQCLIKGATISGLQKQLVLGSYVQYRTVKYSLAFKQSWQDKVDDRGYNEQYTSNSDGSVTLKEIVKGIPPVKPDRPWPLDGAGNKKANITDAPAVLTFQPYPLKDFSVFSFS